MRCTHVRRTHTGLPPSWSQRPGVASDPEHVQRAAAALYGEGIDISTLRCWRRKLIKHNDSVRPPFYGSVPRNNRCVRRRVSSAGRCQHTLLWHTASVSGSC
jgi:hypothetical protein